jgi:hypothetical protein
VQYLEVSLHISLKNKHLLSGICEAPGQDDTGAAGAHDDIVIVPPQLSPCEQYFIQPQR